jgi:hypothetical protein
MANTADEPLIHSEYVTDEVINLERRRVEHFENSAMTTAEKLANIGRFLTRQEIAKMACHTDVVRNTSGVTGSILDIGVYHGHGLMLFAKALAAFVPRMLKGSCIMAYVLNYEGYPGMVTSLLEEVGIRDVRIETPPFYPAINYIWL